MRSSRRRIVEMLQHVPAAHRGGVRGIKLGIAEVRGLQRDAAPGSDLDAAPGRLEADRVIAAAPGGEHEPSLARPHVHHPCRRRNPGASQERELLALV
jgi:hypothetical protein